MSRITKGIRQKRFKVVTPGALKLIIETKSGQRFEFQVTDAALNGIGATSAKVIPDDAGMMHGEIIPESKLVWPENEAPLGRLVLRNSREHDGAMFFGFSCVDMKIPLIGPLSKMFKDIGVGEDSPLDFELSSKKYNIATFLESDHSHPDLFEKCRQYQLLWDDCMKNPLYQYYTVRQDSVWPRANLKLTRTKKTSKYVSFTSYDYLGFGIDQEVKSAAKEAIDKYGVTPGGSPTLCGKTVLHEELEANIARALNKEDALLFNAGFPANLGTLTGILGANDIVIADILSHASIQDGISAAKAKARFFKHNSMRHFETLLKEHRPQHSGALAVTEGLFSMDGDVADLAKFVKIAKANNARTYVDEAHSFGIIGENGLGACERHDVLSDVDIYMGTFSKSLGSGGGFVCASREVIGWLKSFARAGVFSVGLLPASAAAAIVALKKLRSEPERLQKLRANIQHLRKGLAKLGYDCESDPESPIIPVLIGDEAKMGVMNQVLLDHGIFVNPIIFPAVPVNSCRFRFSLSSVHSESDIELLLLAFERAIEKAGVDFEAMKETKLAG